ncbi:leucine-rich repeat domain-containing protein [Pseudomonas putida]|uniref:leucine-rich repeat domain-containing protein n=1 Tax=Pseudomonas putida TaxID=303 RepID=UPI0021641C8A|nr:leucine-rich repeat domain-containing protein [Pseudomonas putida]
MPANNPHQTLLEAQLPQWARQARPNQWAALQQSQGNAWDEQDWFANAAPDLRQAVRASQARLIRSQAALARLLKGLKQITEFAEPLLQHSLAEQGLHAPVHNTRLLRVERTWHWSALRYLYRHRIDNLLQAALQNFADDEAFTSPSAIALSGNIQVTRIQVQGSAVIGMQAPVAYFPLTSERFKVEPLPLSPATFAKCCRELDLGGAYQTHLEEHFAQTKVREQAIRVQKARLRLASDLAYLRHHISGHTHDQLQRLLQGSTVNCWQLALFGINLQDAMLIDTGRGGVALYLPGHDPALRQCNDLEAVHDALATLLLQPDARQAFAGYIMQDERAHFLDLLQQNLDASGNTANDRPWQRAAHADLRPTRQAITVEPFGYFQDLHLTRLKHEASLVAVPTALADASARARRLAEWENLGWDVLNVAGFFIPGVGALMLGVTACQLLGEVYEGYEAWEEGDRHLALRHLEAVGLNLALMGGFVAAGHAVPKLFNSPLMENLHEVPVNDRGYRLWNQDLAPYRSRMELPESLHPNAQGQYLHEGRQYIRMDGHLYQQHFDDTQQQWRIIHPDAQDAWQPPLEHNGQGAWRGQHEQPSQWPFATLARRLGEPFTAFAPLQLERAGRICGIDPARLRQVHLQGQPTPPLLLDTLQRMAAQAEVRAMGPNATPHMFDQLYNGSTPIAPATQQLLIAYPRLSPALARRLLTTMDDAETLAWQEHGRLPTALGRQIEHVHSELPLVRALEDVLQPGWGNTDSERLLFSALDALPKWPADLRLELRAGSPQGPRLDHVGSEQATTVRRVLKSAEGYEADLGERPAPAQRGPDLCRALEQALPPSQREALGIAQSDGNVLREWVLAWADEHRPVLAQRLWGMRAVRRKPQGWLRGGRPLAPLPAPASQTGSLAAAYRRVFPDATDAEFADWLGEEQEDHNPYDTRSATERLRDLQQRLDTLRRDLHQWATPDPSSPHQRHRAIRPIIAAWRRLSWLPYGRSGRLFSLDLSGLDLRDEDLASLALPDDFTHIEHVSLSNNRLLSHLPAEFYERFPNLKRLLLVKCRFQRLPRVAKPEQLRWLDLDSNRITWDGQAQRTLNQFSHLGALDLSGNPLIQAPDLRWLGELRTVFLSDCALTELPQGLDLLTEPLVLDLSSNQFQQLPAAFDVPLPVAETLSLESEWLGQAARAQIEAYNTAHDVDLLVCESDYLGFFDNAGPAETALWQRLPLQFRRGLRPLLDREPFLSHPIQARREFWRRLAVIDTDPVLRQEWLTHPPSNLFNLPL